MREIALETVDVSAEVVRDLGMEDLDEEAVEAFRAGVVRKLTSETQQRRYERMTPESLLEACGLRRNDGRLNQAALLLLGREYAIRQYLGHAEIIAEYRSNPSATNYDRRFSTHGPLMLGLDALMDWILPYAALNPIEIQDGASVVQRPRYSERSIREAILNAVAHRDYTIRSAVDVFLSPEAFGVHSPGPFPSGVTPENVADAREWRNQALAVALEKCSLIERSGQGVNLMMAAAVHHAQPLPEFDEPGYAEVHVVLHGESSDHFRQFTQQLSLEAWEDVPPAALRAVEAMRRNVPVDRMEDEGVTWLLEQGIAQRTQQGYLRPGEEFVEGIVDGARDQIGLGGLEDALVAELRMNEPAGMGKSELEAAFPDHSWRHLRRVLTFMREDGRVQSEGNTRATRWHAAATPS